MRHHAAVRAPKLLTWSLLANLLLGLLAGIWLARKSRSIDGVGAGASPWLP